MSRQLYGGRFKLYAKEDGDSVCIDLLVQHAAAGVGLDDYDRPRPDEAFCVAARSSANDIEGFEVPNGTARGLGGFVLSDDVGWSMS